ncbi:hypothetical protein [Flavobacterium sp.]|nr:hypothetical protein [Flavobacterium sp.]
MGYISLGYTPNGSIYRNDIYLADVGVLQVTIYLLDHITSL